MSGRISGRNSPPMWVRIAHSFSSSGRIGAGVEAYGLAGGGCVMPTSWHRPRCRAYPGARSPGTTNGARPDGRAPFAAVARALLDEAQRDRVAVRDAVLGLEEALDREDDHDGPQRHVEQRREEAEEAEGDGREDRADDRQDDPRDGRGDLEVERLLRLGAREAAAVLEDEVDDERGEGAEDSAEV